jgi:hypothetical protein
MRGRKTSTCVEQVFIIVWQGSHAMQLGESNRMPCTKRVAVMLYSYQDALFNTIKMLPSTRPKRHR